MAILQILDSVLRDMLLPMFRTALLFACTLPAPYLCTACATGLSTVNHVYSRDPQNLQSSDGPSPRGLSASSHEEATGWCSCCASYSVSRLNLEFP